MNEPKVNVVGTVGFGGLLLLLFIALRLCGVVDWSWYWVLSPLWLPACLVLVALLCAIAYEPVVRWIAGK